MTVRDFCQMYIMIIRYLLDNIKSFILIPNSGVNITKQNILDKVKFIKSYINFSNYTENILIVGEGRTFYLSYLLAHFNNSVQTIDIFRDKIKGLMFFRDKVYSYKICNDIRKDYWRNYYMKFDYIFCTSVLEHIYKSEIALKNMINLLKSDGILLCTIDFKSHNIFWNQYEKSKKLPQWFWTILTFHNGLINRKGRKFYHDQLQQYNIKYESYELDNDSVVFKITKQ